MFFAGKNTQKIPKVRLQQKQYLLFYYYRKFFSYPAQAFGAYAQVRGNHPLWHP